MKSQRFGHHTDNFRKTAQNRDVNSVCYAEVFCVVYGQKPDPSLVWDPEEVFKKVRFLCSCYVVSPTSNRGCSKICCGSVLCSICSISNSAAMRPIFCRGCSMVVI